MTHGVTAHTANLEYSDQSGALNESYSDVFGKLVAYKFGKANDWKLGKDLFKDGQRFVRDMENPEVGHMNDYKYKGEFCSRFNDFCGVHTNSGIPSKAAVLLAKKIGLEKLGKIYYLTLTQLLRTNSDFQEAKAQTQAACSTLFGEQSPDCAAVGEAFSAVGI
jgi:aureolysin